MGLRAVYKNYKEGLQMVGTVLLLILMCAGCAMGSGTYEPGLMQKERGFVEDSRRAAVAKCLEKNGIPIIKNYNLEYCQL